MNVIFECLSDIDDELIAGAAEELTRGKNRRNALKIVKYAVITAAAAAACFAIPFGITKWSGINDNIPEEGTSASTSGGGTDIITAAETPCIKVFDYIESGLPNERWMDADTSKLAQTFTVPDRPGIEYTWAYTYISDGSKGLYGGQPIQSVYLADITGDGKYEICSSLSWCFNPVIGEKDYDNSVYIVTIYDLSEEKCYTLHGSGDKNFILFEKDGELWVRIYDDPKPAFDDEAQPFEEKPLTLSMLTPAIDMSEEQPEENNEYTAPPAVDESGEDIELTNEQLRAMLLEKGEKALEMYSFAYFGGIPELGGKSVETITDDPKDQQTYYSLPDDWYFHTVDEMESYLRGYFNEYAVSGFMYRISETEVIDGKIKRQKPASLVSVDGELYMLPGGKDGYLPPDFSSAYIERIVRISNTCVTFRADVVIEDDGHEHYYEPGKYCYRGTIVYENGDWKFTYPEPATRFECADTVIPPLDIETSFSCTYSARVYSPPKSYLNIDGACFKQVDASDFRDGAEPDYDALARLPRVGRGRASIDAALNDFRSDTANGTGPLDVYRFDADRVVAKNALGEYTFYLFDIEHTELAADVKAIYNEWQGENSVGITGMSLTSNHWNMVNDLRVSVYMDMEDADKFFKFINRNNLDMGLIFTEYSDPPASSAAASDAYFTDEELEFRFIADKAAIAYVNNERRVLEEMGAAELLPKDFGLYLNGINRAVARFPSSYSFSSRSAEFTLIPENGDMNTYLTVVFEKDENGGYVIKDLYIQG